MGFEEYMHIWALKLKTVVWNVCFCLKTFWSLKWISLVCICVCIYVWKSELKNCWGGTDDKKDQNMHKCLHDMRIKNVMSTYFRC